MEHHSAHEKELEKEKERKKTYTNTQAPQHHSPHTHNSLNGLKNTCSSLNGLDNSLENFKRYNSLKEYNKLSCTYVHVCMTFRQLCALNHEFNGTEGILKGFHVW